MQKTAPQNTSVSKHFIKKFEVFTDYRYEIAVE